MMVIVAGTIAPMEPMIAFILVTHMWWLIGDVYFIHLESFPFQWLMEKKLCPCVFQKKIAPDLRTVNVVILLERYILFGWRSHSIGVYLHAASWRSSSFIAYKYTLLHAYLATSHHRLLANLSNLCASMTADGFSAAQCTVWVFIYSLLCVRSLTVRVLHIWTHNSSQFFFLR